MSKIRLILRKDRAIPESVRQRKRREIRELLSGGRSLADIARRTLSHLPKLGRRHEDNT